MSACIILVCSKCKFSAWLVIALYARNGQLPVTGLPINQNIFFDNN